MDVRRPAVRTTWAGAVLVLALVPAGCGKAGSGAPPQVTVHIGSDSLALRPTQYCADGTGHRYQLRPPNEPLLRPHRS